MPSTEPAPTTYHPAATKLATEVAWQGHQSDARASTFLVDNGVPPERVADVLAAAVAAGLLKPVDRLGGYVAGRATNTQVFGLEFAAWLEL